MGLQQGRGGKGPHIFAFQVGRDIGEPFQLRDDLTVRGDDGLFQTVGHGLCRLHQQHTGAIGQGIDSRAKIGEAGGLKALSLQRDEVGFHKQASGRATIQNHGNSFCQDGWRSWWSRARPSTGTARQARTAAGDRARTLSAKDVGR